MSYVDGFVLPVPEGRLDQYKEMAATAGKIWKDHGALMYKECVLEDAEPKMPEGCSIALFKDLAGTKDGETVIMAFILYNSREHRDEVNAKVMADERMNNACPDPDNMPFEFQRMCFGGFEALVDL